MLQTNKILLNPEKSFEQERVTIDMDFARAMLNSVSTSTEGLNKAKDGEHEITQKFHKTLTGLEGAYNTYFSFVDAQYVGLRSLQQLGNVIQICNLCKLLCTNKITRITLRVIKEPSAITNCVSIVVDEDH